MTDFGTWMKQGHEAYIAAARSRDNVALWQNYLHQAIGYTSEALLVCSQKMEHARAYSQLTEIYQELGDLDAAERYARVILDYVPDDIIAYSQLLQIACLRYYYLSASAAGFTVSQRGQIGARLRRDFDLIVQAARVDSSAKVLIEKISTQMSTGQLNAVVYIGILKQTIEFAVPYLIAGSKLNTVREIYLLAITGPWHNYMIGEDLSPEFMALQMTARGGLSAL